MLLTIFNLFVTVVLMMFNVRGNIFIGMVITAIIALFNGMITLPKLVCMANWLRAYCNANGY